MADGTYLEYAKLTLRQYASLEAKSRHALVKEVGDFEVKRVLDVGCGAGLSLLPFAELKKADCFGIDVGEEVGEVGRHVFREQGFDGKGFFVRAFGNYGGDAVRRVGRG